jgi:hypothetical protein
MPTIAELLERDCVVLMESTIPAHMTVAEWRRVRPGYPARTQRGARLRRVREPVR